jgi:hypothetical protein
MGAGSSNITPYIVWPYLPALWVAHTLQQLGSLRLKEGWGGEDRESTIMLSQPGRLNNPEGSGTQEARSSTNPEFRTHLLVANDSFRTIPRRASRLSPAKAHHRERNTPPRPTSAPNEAVPPEPSWQGLLAAPARTGLATAFRPEHRWVHRHFPPRVLSIAHTRRC